MGTPKLLLPLGERSVIERVVDAILASPVDETLVVVAAGDRRIRDALAPRPVQYVDNADRAGDMLSSLRCALRALPTATEAVVVVPADQAGLTTRLVESLVDQLPANIQPPVILVPTRNGKRGHPLIVTRCFVDELLNQFDGEGLRGLLRAHPEAVMEVVVQEDAALDDLDTPEDYRRLRERLREA